MWFYDKDIEMSDLIDLFCSVLLSPVSVPVHPPMAYSTNNSTPLANTGLLAG
jgi:hypothetical protein